MMSISWVTVLAVAVSAIGLIQWLKNIWPKAKGVVWAIASPLLCIVLAAAFAYLPPFVVIAALGFAFAQIGYESIIKWVQARIDGI